jgi:lipopolysaccharide transport system permease protein
MENKSEASFLPQIIIEPSSEWDIVDWREAWHRKDLLFLFVWRDLKSQYTQSIFGFSWGVIRPLMMMLIFSVVFGYMLGLDSNGLPYVVFIYAALVPWTYFSTCFGGTSNSLTSGMGLISKVYFPRIILPLSIVFVNLIDFAVSIVLLFVLMTWFGLMPTFWAIFMLPILIIQLMILTLSLGMLTAGLSVQYRDVSQIIGIFVQFLLYSSPVIYPTSSVPEQYQLLYAINPMVGIIESWRSSLFGIVPIRWDMLMISLVITMIMFLSGLFVFRRLEKSVVDYA